MLWRIDAAVVALLRILREQESTTYYYVGILPSPGDANVRTSDPDCLNFPGIVDGENKDLHTI